MKIWKLKMNKRSLVVKTWSKNFLNCRVGAGFRDLCLTMLLGSSWGVATPSLAGADAQCHFHGSKAASEATVLTCSDVHKSRLIKKGTIQPVWAHIKHDSIQQVEGKKGKKEWKVVFKDPAAADKSKETLYMFFSVSGNLLASNFTGQ